MRAASFEAAVKKLLSARKSLHFTSPIQSNFSDLMMESILFKFIFNEPESLNKNADLYNQGLRTELLFSIQNSK